MTLGFCWKGPSPSISESVNNEVTDSIVPYRNCHEHLVDELRWLKRMLSVQVARMRQVNFYQDATDFRSFFIADEEVDALLANGIGDSGCQVNEKSGLREVEKLSGLAKEVRLKIDSRVGKSLADGVFLPLRQLQKLFLLSEFELQTILVCLAPEVDARYDKLYAYLHNDVNRRAPSKELMIGLLADGMEDHMEHINAFNNASPLLHYGLIQAVDNRAGSSISSSSFHVDTRVVQYVLGSSTIDPRLLADLRVLSPLSWDEIVIAASFQNRLQKLVNRELSENGKVSIYLHGRAGVGKKTIARALCGTLDLPLAVVDIGGLLAAPDAENFDAKLRNILREALLHPCAVCFDCMEKLENVSEDDSVFYSTLIRNLQELGWITFFCGKNPLPSVLLNTSKQIYSVQVRPPEFEEQTALWETHLNRTAIKRDPVNLAQIVNRFDLTGGQILRAVLRAEASARIRDPDNTTLTVNDLLSSSRVESQPKLSSLARKIEPKYRWRDLVLPEDQMLQLHEIAAEVKHRHRVMADWGFGAKLSLGRGINALFAGPSGTGKTMAAEVIGGELDLDIYKIDLSAVVSKYIGETEKNLNRLFNEAEHSNSILFFDEADALLGKRSEVKDAHDRFANIEIAYLLQKMEEYEGITMLATNLRKNIDEAFVRRIQYIVDFPTPDSVHRERIWRNTFPDQAPIATDIDFSFLAGKFKLTGGNIKNIGMRAAYFAAQDKGAICMQHLVRATKRELQKMGKLYTEAEFGDYGQGQEEL